MRNEILEMGHDRADLGAESAMGVDGIGSAGGGYRWERKPPPGSGRRLVHHSWKVMIS